MSTVGSYPVSNFSPTQYFLVYNPSSQTLERVLGSELVTAINGDAVYVRAVSTRAVAQTLDLEIGVILQTGGGTVAGDGGSGAFLVVATGEGDFVMNNGNELLALPRGSLAGSDLDGALVTDDGLQTAIEVSITRRKVAVPSVADLYGGDWGQYDYLETQAHTAGGSVGGADWYKSGTGGTPTTAGTLLTDLALGYVVDAGGNYWYLRPDQDLYAEMFGCVGDNSTDDKTGLLAGLAVGPIHLTPGTTYYVSNAALPDNSMIFFNGAKIRGGLTPGDGFFAFNDPVLYSDEGDARPLTLSSASNVYMHKPTIYYTGTTGIQAVVYADPTSHVVSNIRMDHPEIYCTQPTANANTRGLKFYNKVAQTGSCRDIYIHNVNIHDTPSMGFEVVSEWGGGSGDYDDPTALGHQDMIITGLIDNCGQTVGSQSKIGASFAGTGRARADLIFKNANGKNFEFVSQLGSEIKALITDTASGFDSFSTSAPGGDPSAVNYKCKIEVTILNGNSQLANILGFEEGEIRLTAFNIQRAELGCYECDLWLDVVAAGNIGARTSGGYNTFRKAKIDILAAGASGTTALRFFGASSEGNVVEHAELLTDASVTHWDENSSATDNVVQNYVHKTALESVGTIHNRQSYTFQIAADANENLNVRAENADYLTVTSAVSLTATRTVTVTSDREIDMTIENSTTGGQSVTIGYSTGSTVTVPNGNLVKIVGNGSNIKQLS